MKIGSERDPGLRGPRPGGANLCIADPVVRVDVWGDGNVGKRNCGSCRHFADAGMARSGWCHHPERKRDGLVMVRRNELACINGWKKDLWDARPENGADLTVTVAPLPPATPAEIAAAAVFAQPIRSETADGADDEPRDVVVGEQPSLWRSEPAPRPIDVPLSNDEIRVAEERGGSGTIRRAHEIQRERALGQSRYVGLPFGTWETVSSPADDVSRADAAVPAGPEADSPRFPAADAPDAPSGTIAGTATGDPVAGVTPRTTLDIERGAPLASRPMRWTQPGAGPSHDDGAACHGTVVTPHADASVPMGRSDAGAHPDAATRDPLPRHPVSDERPAPVLSWRRGGADREAADEALLGGQGPSHRDAEAMTNHAPADERPHGTTGFHGAATPDSGESMGPQGTSRSPRDGQESPVRAPGGTGDPLVSVTMAERRQWRQRWQASELVGEAADPVAGALPDALSRRDERRDAPAPLGDRRNARQYGGHDAAGTREEDRAAAAPAAAGRGTTFPDRVPAGQRSGEGTRGAVSAEPGPRGPASRASGGGPGRSPLSVPRAAADAGDPVDLPLVSQRSPEVAATGPINGVIRLDDRVVATAGGDSGVAGRWATQIASVPKMCATCRDFRPAESGERGWCTNTHAFTHRRMVTAEEQPCESIIGTWWLPHDMVWLGTDDIQAHGLPTPLVDTLLGDGSSERLGERDGAMRRAGR